MSDGLSWLEEIEFDLRYDVECGCPNCTDKNKLERFKNHVRLLIKKYKAKSK